MDAPLQVALPQTLQHPDRFEVDPQGLDRLARKRAVLHALNGELAVARGQLRDAENVLEVLTAKGIGRRGQRACQ